MSQLTMRRAAVLGLAGAITAGAIAVVLATSAGEDASEPRAPTRSEPSMPPEDLDRIPATLSPTPAPEPPPEPTLDPNDTGSRATPVQLGGTWSPDGSTWALSGGLMGLVPGGQKPSPTLFGRSGFPNHSNEAPDPRAGTRGRTGSKAISIP